MSQKDEYPARESHFAHKFTRRILRCAAAQELGAEAVLLCVCIAHTEDVKRYSAAVTYWNDQLANILGMSWGRLDRARKKAKDSGWLHYERGGKGKVGKYWVKIPEHAAVIEDGDFSADDLALSLQNGDTNGGQTDLYLQNGDESGETNGGQTGDKRGTFIPNPIPNPVYIFPKALEKNEEFLQSFSIFAKFVGMKTGRPLDKIRADVLLMKCYQRGAKKAAADLLFSVEKNSTNLLDSEDDFFKSRGNGKPDNQKYDSITGEPK